MDSLMSPLSSVFQTPTGQGPPLVTCQAGNSMSNGEDSADDEPMNKEGDENHEVMVCVIQGCKEHRERIGFASIDMKTITVRVAEFYDDSYFTILMRRLDDMGSCKILVPKDRFEEKTNSVFMSNLKKDTSMIPLDRHLFHPEDGLRSLQQLTCQDPVMVAREVKNMKLALSAASALISYATESENDLMQSVAHSRSLKIEVDSDGLVIDSESCQSLDMKGSIGPLIFPFIKTKGGKRALIELMEKPMVNEEDIKRIHDAIDCLIKDKDLMSGVKQIMSQLNNSLDGMVIKLMETGPKPEVYVDSMVLLKHALNQVQPLIDLFPDHSMHPLYDIRDELNRSAHLGLLELINEYINDKCVYTNGCINFKTSKMMAVKEEKDPAIAIQRCVYTDAIEDMTYYVADIGNKMGVGSALKMIYSVGKGFHMEIPKKDFPKMLTSCQQVMDSFGITLIDQDQNPNRNRTQLKMTTMQMFVMNNKMMETQNIIYALCCTQINQLIMTIRGYTKHVDIIVDAITRLDVIQALAQSAQHYNMVKPSFGEKTMIEQGNHPFLFYHHDRIKNQESCVTNNTFMSPELPFHLILGANMSGKSMYLRQVGLLQIMAQMGSFIPAQSGTFRLADKIITRIGGDDDVRSSVSSFTHEVRGIKFVMEHVTNRSLILMDELGRGTSHEEGFSLCVAAIEALLDTGAFVLFATHFHPLTQLSQFYPYIECHLMESKVMNNKGQSNFVFTHRLTEYTDQVEPYGLQLAQSVGIHQDIVNDANDLLQRIKLDSWVLNKKTDIKDQFTIVRHLVKLAQKANLPNSLKNILGIFKHKLSQMDPQSLE